MHFIRNYSNFFQLFQLSKFLNTIAKLCFLLDTKNFFWKYQKMAKFEIRWKKKSMFRACASRAKNPHFRFFIGDMTDHFLSLPLLSRIMQFTFPENGTPGLYVVEASNVKLMKCSWEICLSISNNLVAFSSWATIKASLVS